MFRGFAVIRSQLFVRSYSSAWLVFVRMARLPAERIRGIRTRGNDASAHRR